MVSRTTVRRQERCDCPLESDYFTHVCIPYRVLPQSAAAVSSQQKTTTSRVVGAVAATKQTSMHEAPDVFPCFPCHRMLILVPTATHPRGQQGAGRPAAQTPTQAPYQTGCRTLTSRMMTPQSAPRSRVAIPRARRLREGCRVVGAGMRCQRLVPARSQTATDPHRLHLPNQATGNSVPQPAQVCARSQKHSHRTDM